MKGKLDYRGRFSCHVRGCQINLVRGEQVDLVQNDKLL